MPADDEAQVEMADEIFPGVFNDHGVPDEHDAMEVPEVVDNDSVYSSSSSSAHDGDDEDAPAGRCGEVHFRRGPPLAPPWGAGSTAMMAMVMPPAWQASILPLNQRCRCSHQKMFDIGMAS